MIVKGTLILINKMKKKKFRTDIPTFLKVNKLICPQFLSTNLFM